MIPIAAVGPDPSSPCFPRHEPSIARLEQVEENAKLKISTSKTLKHEKLCYRSPCWLSNNALLIIMPLTTRLLATVKGA